MQGRGHGGGEGTVVGEGFGKETSISRHSKDNKKEDIGA